MVSMDFVCLAVTNYRIDSMAMTIIITIDDNELIMSALKLPRNIKVAEELIYDCKGTSLANIITVQLINESKA